MRRHLVPLIVALVTACAGSPAAPGPAPGPAPRAEATPPAPPPSTAVTATGLFSAYGGVGIVPDPIPPGYDTSLAVVVVAIENPGPPREGVTITNGALLLVDGTSLGSMRHVTEAVVLPSSVGPTPTGQFGDYLGDEGTPFTGALPTGRTVLRVRFALDRDPVGAPMLGRIELTGTGDAPLVVDADIEGAWATS